MKRIVAEELIDIVVQTIFLKKTETWLCGLYKGATFIGLTWDHTDVDIKSKLKSSDELFPKDLNDLDTFKNKYGDRVTYHPVTDYSYFDLSDIKLERIE
jgi:hypothetical protein